MRYSDDQLLLLRQRWDRLLLDGGEPRPVDGQRTFQELLQVRLAQISRLVSDRFPVGGELPPVGALRDFWGEECDHRFTLLVAELAACGLDSTIPLASSRYEVREPLDLRGAVLSGVNLRGAFLENVHFEGADLARACLAGVRCFAARFDGADCTAACFEQAECNFASFQGAVCDQGSFVRADCSMADFSGAKLRHADFSKAGCFAAKFDGAYLANADLTDMAINHLTSFGVPGELGEAEASIPIHALKKGEGEDWYIAELLPAWLRAAQVACRIKLLFRVHGYFLKADEYQYLEMVCQRHLLQQSRSGEFCEWFFKDLMFGYGLKWKRPFITILTIILLWGGGFALHFRMNDLHGMMGSLGYGLYYSIISFTTLGLGHTKELNGVWPMLLLCSEALLGTILMPLFLLAYARKILQN